MELKNFGCVLQVLGSLLLLGLYPEPESWVLSSVSGIYIGLTQKCGILNCIVSYALHLVALNFCLEYDYLGVLLVCFVPLMGKLCLEESKTFELKDYLVEKLQIGVLVTNSHSVSYQNQPFTEEFKNIRNFMKLKPVESCPIEILVNKEGWGVYSSQSKHYVLVSAQLEDGSSLVSSFPATQTFKLIQEFSGTQCIQELVETNLKDQVNEITGSLELLKQNLDKKLLPVYEDMFRALLVVYYTFYSFEDEKELKEVLVSPKKEVEFVMNIINPTAKRKNTTLKLKSEKDVPVVKADKSKLRQVFFDSIRLAIAKSTSNSLEFILKKKADEVLLQILGNYNFEELDINCLTLQKRCQKLGSLSLKSNTLSVTFRCSSIVPEDQLSQPLEEP